MRAHAVTALPAGWPRGVVLATVLALACQPAPGDARPLPHWDLVEERRFGAAGDEPGALGDVRGFAADDAGRVFVLDFQLREVLAFDSTGALLRPLTRRGAGPGELAEANGMLRAPDGRLWLNDYGNSRLTVVDPNGGPPGSHPMSVWGYAFLWHAFFDGEGRLYELASIRRDTTRLVRWRRFTPGATLRVDTLATVPCAWTGLDRPIDERWLFRGPRGGMRVPFAPGPFTVADPRGASWCGWTGTPRLVRERWSDGDTSVFVTWQRPPVAVTTEERDTAIAQVRDFMRRIGQPNYDLDKIPRMKPAIATADVDPRGRLWVRPMTADSGTVFDLYDSAGTPVATARAPFRIKAYRPLYFAGERVYTVVEDGDGIPYIVRARIDSAASPGSRP